VTEPDYAQMKEFTRQVWGLGDYPRIAELILPAARSLVDACAISAGQEVLDVAAGNGNLAVVAGEEGADVVASDIAPAQVALGRARTEAEGLDVEWAEADVEELPFEDGRFDCAASVFGRCSRRGRSWRRASCSASSSRAAPSGSPCGGRTGRRARSSRR
jgi:SAM-dependent methyltransferase